LIYEVANKLKEVVGIVDNLAVLERESFDIIFTELRDQFTIEKVVQLNLKDYGDKKVYIVKISKDGK
jgi:hypothetical protein